MKTTIPFFRFFILAIFIFGGSYAMAQATNDSTIHVVAEQMPSFPGGANARNEFLVTHLKYPRDAIKKEITGKVYVSFVVEPDGSISHIKVLKGIGHGCDKEAMQVVAQMPKWKPGLIKGKPVRVRFTLPFTFNIHGPDEGKVYTQADSYPVFGTGQATLNNYLLGNMHYPVGMIKGKVIDTVNVFFIVEPKGNITHVSVRKDSNRLNAYDYEAMRLVKKIPVNKPAYVGQRPVRLALFIPVVFDYRLIDSTSATRIDTFINHHNFSYYEPERIYKEVENMPSFPGGAMDLMRYLAQNIQYPKEAKRKHEQGKVFINFIVEADGSISHIRIVKGASPALNAEALKVIRAMPRWIPGTHNGKPVRVSFNLPVKFTLP